VIGLASWNTQRLENSIGGRYILGRKITKYPGKNRGTTQRYKYLMEGDWWLKATWEEENIT
jgi:hypothetical protein